jgi:hypothetical protein
MAAPVIAALARPVLGYIAREGGKMLAMEAGKMAMNRVTASFRTDSEDFSQRRAPVNIVG